MSTYSIASLVALVVCLATSNCSSSELMYLLKIAQYEEFCSVVFIVDASIARFASGLYLLMSVEVASTLPIHVPSAQLISGLVADRKGIPRSR